MNGTASASALTVGQWTVRPEVNRLVRGDESVTIQPLSMDILVYLAERPGVVVTPQELLDTFWERRVVGDDAVHRRVADLRRHLGDDARHPRYIETIPKRGYRLVASVTDGAAPDLPAPVAAAKRGRRILILAGPRLGCRTSQRSGACKKSH